MCLSRYFFAFLLPQQASSSSIRRLYTPHLLQILQVRQVTYKDASQITTLPPKPPRGACFLRLLMKLNRLARGSLNCDRTTSAVAIAIFLSVLSCPCFNRFHNGYKALKRPRNESKVISTAGEQLRQHGTIEARYRARTFKRPSSRFFLPPP